MFETTNNGTMGCWKRETHSMQVWNCGIQEQAFRTSINAGFLVFCLPISSRMTLIQKIGCQNKYIHIYIYIYIHRYIYIYYHFPAKIQSWTHIGPKNDGTIHMLSPYRGVWSTEEFGGSLCLKKPKHILHHANSDLIKTVGFLKQS